VNSSKILAVRKRYLNTPQQHWEHTAATMRMSCHTEASLSDRCRGLSDRKKRELGALDYFVSARTNKD